MGIHSEQLEVLLLINANVRNAVDALDVMAGRISLTETKTKSLGAAFKIAAGIMLRDFVRGAMTAVIDVLGDASDSFQAYESTLTRIIAATTVSGKEADELRATFEDLVMAQTDIGYSGREAASGLESLIKAGMSAKDAATALRSALSLARIEQISTQEASNLLVQTLTMFNLTANKSAEALTLLSQAADAGIDTALGYAKGISNAGANANMLGIQLNETLAALVILDKTFGNAAESGTFLNMMFRTLIRDNEKLGLSLYNTDGSVRALSDIIEQLRANYAAFGADTSGAAKYLATFEIRAQQAAMALLNYDGSIEDILERMRESKTAHTKLNEILETKAARLAIVNAEIENMTYELGAMTAEMELAWKQFAVGLGPIGAVITALGPTMLQGAMTGLMIMTPQIITMLQGLSGTMRSLTLASASLAIGIAAAFVSFNVVSDVLNQLPAEGRVVVGILVAITSALGVATVAAAVFYSVISATAALPLILAGIASAVAAVSVVVSTLDNDAQKVANSLDTVTTSLDSLGDGATALEEIVEKSGSLALDFVKNTAMQLAMLEYSAYQGKLDRLEDSYEDEFEVTQTNQERVIDLYNEHYDKLEKDRTDAYEQELEDIEDSYEEDFEAVEVGLQNILDAYGIHFIDLRSDQEVFYDDAIAAVNDHYDNLEDELEDHLETEKGRIEDEYENETDIIEEQHDKRIDATVSFYDRLIGVINDGLSEIRDGRSAELDLMELDYLLELTALEASYENKEISSRTFNKALKKLEETYRDERSTARTSWRIKELQYELDHAGEVEGLQDTKNEKIVALEERKNGELETAERKKNALIEGLEEVFGINMEDLADLKRKALGVVEEQLKKDLDRIEERKNISIKEAEAEFNDDMKALAEQKNSDISGVNTAFEGLAQTHQDNLDRIEIDETTARAGVVLGIYGNVVVQFGNYVNTMEGYARSAVITAEDMARDVKDAAMEATRAILEITQSEIPAPEYVYSRPEILYNIAQDAYLKGDYSKYNALLTEAVALGFISGAEYQEYHVPGYAKGGVVTKPTVLMAGEAGPEAIIPLEKMGSLGFGTVIVDIHDNVFSSEIDVARVFEEETDKLARKLITQGVGRVPL